MLPEGPGGVRSPYFTRVPPYVRRAFSSKETGEYRKGTFPARPLYQGVRGSVWERGSEIGADRRRSGPSCVLPKGVPQGQTESGGIVLAAICWATSAQRRCHPEETLY